jgi:hypothetical protein
MEMMLAQHTYSVLVVELKFARRRYINVDGSAANGELAW